MDDWFSSHPRPRRGRSSLEYTFSLQPPGPAIRAQHPYAFLDCLEHQNTLLVHREINDPVYRGDVKPQDSCAWLATSDSPVDVDDASTAATRHSSPHERRSSPVTPGERSPSPTMSDLVDAPRGLITYSKTDKKRVHAARVHAAILAATPVSHGRRSARLRSARRDVLEGEALREEMRVSLGHEVVPWVNDIPRPIIDRLEYIIAVVAGGPKGQSDLWNSVIKEIGKACRRMHRNNLFTQQPDQRSYIRFGIGYGEEYAAPHEIARGAALAREVDYMRNSAAFNLMSAYHNHLYAQFAPRGHASAANQVDELVNRGIAYPAFDNSVFTTTEINFWDAATLSQKNYNGALDTMEAITVVGKAHLVFWEDDKVLELPSGATVIFPAGTKRYSFLPAAPGEERFLIRQFCNGAVLRWIEKGGYSDTEFASMASPEMIDAWNEKRERRGQEGLKMFSKLGDVFV